VSTINKWGECGTYAEEHASVGGQEEGTTSNTFDQEGSRDGDDKIVDSHAQVEVLDLSLVVDTDSNLLKDDVEVVGGNTVAGPLREESDGDNNPEAATVTGCPQEREVRDGVSDLTLETESLLDFLSLEQDEGVPGVAALKSVVLGEHMDGLVLLALGDEPTRGLGDEEEDDDLENGHESHHRGGDTPCSRSVDTESAESCGGSAEAGG
jgi:hypothetical protein